MKLELDALQVSSFEAGSATQPDTTNYSPYSPDCCTVNSGCDTNEAAGCTHVLGCNTTDITVAAA